ncbi:MAG: M48 family metalloprotease [Haloarculaceae archaeon]
MRRPVLRALMVVVGVTTLAVYLAATYLVYLLAKAVWALRPSTGTLLVGLALATAVSAYVSYQVGTARLLSSARARELPPEELSAILAHELAHIDHRDSLVQTFGFSALQTLSGVVFLLVAPVLVLSTGFARALAWIRGSPARWDRTLPGLFGRGVESAVSAALFVLTLGLLALSRRRELAADDRAAEVTGNPVALARALRKIERATDPRWGIRSQLYVRGDEDNTLLRLLSTHPATDERVERLREHATAQADGRRIPVE